MTATPPPPDPASWVQPPPARRRPTWWYSLLAIGIAVALVGVVGGGILAVTALTRDHPRDTAVAYLDAIAAGDVAAANALTATSSSTTLPAVSSMQGATGIVVQRVSPIAEATDTDAHYAVEFTVDGASVMTTLELVRTGGGGEWLVRETLARGLRLTTTAPEMVSVAIGGVAVEPSTVPLLPTLLYPGAYTAVVTTQQHMVADDLSIVVADADVEARIAPTATEDAIETVVTLAEDTLAACTEQSSRSAASCDEVVAVSSAQSSAEVAWRIDGPATVRTHPELDPWGMTISATVVATYADPSGAMVDERITVETEAMVDVAPSGEIGATFRWTSDL